MKVRDLKKFLETVSDDAILVVEYRDHYFRKASFENYKVIVDNNYKTISEYSEDYINEEKDVKAVTIVTPAVIIT